MSCCGGTNAGADVLRARIRAHSFENVEGRRIYRVDETLWRDYWGTLQAHERWALPDNRPGIASHLFPLDAPGTEFVGVVGVKQNADL